ncbi:MAG: ribosome biogenesis GTP-binding protein YihA/YsxC [Pyrinomonadaceae bacterium]
MKIISAEFERSCFGKSDWVADGRPEIAFLGRSNVGKSSLLNSLLGRKGLARTSNTPGRTQSINFFLVNGKFHFVDLPGYGYARVSKSMRADWGVMAREYLTEREELVLSVQLVDARHEPSELDKQLNEWLHFNNKRHIVVATKADKLSANQLKNQFRAIAGTFGESRVFVYSSQTGKGRPELWAEIAQAIEKN